MTSDGTGRAPAGRARRSQMLLLVAVGVVAAALTLEAALRVADAAGWIDHWRDGRRARALSLWIKSDNPELIYRHRSGYVRGRVRVTEGHGILRPTDVSLHAEPGTLRIAALGDSVGATLKLPYERRMFSLAEAALTRLLHRRVEILNFSVNGYSTTQEAALVEEAVAPFDPDVIVLQYCANDFYPTRYPTLWFLDPPAFPSYLAELARHRLDTRLIDGYPPAAFWERLYREDAAGWRAVTEGFARIARHGRAGGIKPLLLIFPLFSHGGWYEGDARGRHARVASTARAQGFAVLDLLPIYARYPVETLRLDPWDTFHPNALGHCLAADALVGALLDALQVERPPSAGPAMKCT